MNRSSSPTKSFILVLALGLIGVALIAIFADRTFSLVRDPQGVSPIPNSYLVNRSGAYADQNLECADVPSPQKLTKFTKAPDIVRVIVCEELFTNPQKQSQVEYIKTAANAVTFENFAQALAVSDEREQLNFACTEEWQIRPSFVIELESGDMVYPAAPLDVCRKPQQSFTEAFDMLRGLMID